MMTIKTGLKAPDCSNLAKRQSNYILEIRRELHRIPELGWQEEKTLFLIKYEIEKLLPLIPFNAHLVEKAGGIYVDIDIDETSPRILFRADIDALPIEEKTDLPFSSNHPGLMHACGHDCHTAMLLGFLRALASGAEPAHNLRLVWQRAEEMLTTQSGGAKLAEEGVFEGIHHAFGLHVSTPLKSGTFYSRPGIMMANAAHLCIEIECLGGHVMRPDLGSNAVDITAEIHVALRNIVSTTLAPYEKMNLVPSVSRAGDTFNIMPNQATVWYSMRNFLEPRRLHEFLRLVREKVQCIVSSFPDAQIKAFRFHQGFPILVNDERSYELVNQTLKSHKFKTDQCELLYSGEDFAFYSENCPSSFWLLGAKQGAGYDHHTALFNPDETALWKGCAFWLALSQGIKFF